MRLDVLLDNLIRHIAGADRKVAPCPQVPPPELAAQFTKLGQHPPTAASFQPLHQLTHRQTRRHRHQQVNVIDRYMPGDDVHIQRLAGLTDQLAQADGDLTAQYRLAILGDPHHMVFQVVNRVCRLAVAHDPFGIDTLQHRHDHSVQAAALPPARQTAQSARPDVKTACLKAGVSDPIYRQ
jgi:hypothetical protein